MSRAFVGALSLLRGRFSSHISSRGHNLCKNRHFIKFPRIFKRRNPELISTAKINLHDHSTGFINFINTLDSLISSNNVNVESFIELFEKFESSLSDDNEHMVKTLSSYDTVSLLFMLDSLTIYTQNKTSKNIINLMNNLCSVLSHRDLMKTENDEFDISYNMALMDILNRINSDSKEVKLLMASVNKQSRTHVDFLIEKGKFTHFMNLFSYTLDPNSVYAIVYCCLFKLDKFKCDDFANIPGFLFKFKIFDDNILSNVVSLASSSPYATFESDFKSFNKFVKDLLLFEMPFNMNFISFSPAVVYLDKLKANIVNYNDDELLFLLSGFPSKKHFIVAPRINIGELTYSILVRLGILSESLEFKGIAHLSNWQLMNLVKYVNKYELKPSKSGWKRVRSILLKQEVKSPEPDVPDKLEGSSLMNDLARDFSSRFLKEVPQGCKLIDVDDVFKNTGVLSDLMSLLNQFYVHNVDEIYVNSFSLSLSRLLALMEDNDFQDSELLKFMNDVSSLNVKTLTEFSSQLYKLANRNDLELKGKALRFRLLDLKKSNTLSETPEMIQHFDSFESLKDKADSKSVLTLLNLLDIVNKTKQLSDEAHKEAFDGVFEKMSGLVYECVKKEFGLFDYKSMTLLLNLPADCSLLSQMDELIDLETKVYKVPQLVTMFIYRLKRTNDGKQGFEGVKKVYDVLMSRLEELVNVLESHFSHRVWLKEPTSSNNIRKINPWLNEHGIRVLFKAPTEHLDMFLYEKCPKIDEYFDLSRYTYAEQESWGDKRLLNSLHELKMELIELSRKVGVEELKLSAKVVENRENNIKNLVIKLGAELRRATLAVEMCRPISRDRYLPKKHADQLVKLTLKQISNVKGGENQPVWTVKFYS
ncbi:uncharacterized protein TOT_020000152 [Theileria orientalis strain Shintoku]|uniref:Uncharacterized protein n=1 Tax=Theileria orientalis strain Shintoku TaxID=869250 RepID=J4D707_THEOR|nr:uncharacterized protein TOT_020000152 [Theileria orientalis strain Shintoku]BAM39880.1 uncharacterized protein TOT_020000152 [Theileria orientalis strain Shintoku]|eukprot:XP_009690181.1 uncharacterized protein TOT_020000152 [Theileria orientalis strain Shintoku]